MTTPFVPATISSQFDETGRERIHAAPVQVVSRTLRPPSPPGVPEIPVESVFWTNPEATDYYLLSGSVLLSDLKLSSDSSCADVTSFENMVLASIDFRFLPNPPASFIYTAGDCVAQLTATIASEELGIMDESSFTMVTIESDGTNLNYEFRFPVESQAEGWSPAINKSYIMIVTGTADINGNSTPFTWYFVDNR